MPRAALAAFAAAFVTMGAAAHAQYCLPPAGTPASIVSDGGCDAGETATYALRQLRATEEYLFTQGVVPADGHQRFTKGFRLVEQLNAEGSAAAALVELRRLTPYALRLNLNAGQLLYQRAHVAAVAALEARWKEKWDAGKN